MICEGGGIDSTKDKEKPTDSFETMAVKRWKPFVILKPSQQTGKFWTLKNKDTADNKKEATAVAATCCSASPSSSAMRMSRLIGLFTATTILTIVLVLARQQLSFSSNLGLIKTVTMDGLKSDINSPHSKQQTNNNSHLTDEEIYRQMLSHERSLMRPSLAGWKPVDEDRVAQEWRGDGGIGGAGLNKGDRDNPSHSLDERRAQTIRSGYLATIESAPSLGRWSSHNTFSRSAVQAFDSSAKSAQMDHPSSVAAAGRAGFSGRATISTETPLKHRQNEAINIDKIKGIEASPSDIRELKTLDDLEASESTNGETISGTSLVQLECAATNKYDVKIAQMMKQNNLSRPIIKSDGRFDNPFPTWTQQSIMDAFRFTVLESDESNVPKNKRELDEQLPLVKPDFVCDNFDEFRVTWIGHSTMLIQVNGLNILTDPIFSERASPTQFFGPKRIIEPACKIKNLPRVDIVLISHNHYDHLDVDSVRELNDRFGIECRWIVPLGLGAFMESMRVRNYVELNWWQKDCFPLKSDEIIDGDNKADKLAESSKVSTLFDNVPNDTLAVMYVDNDKRAEELSIYFTPAQHWSRRGVNDVNKSLWGSYTIVNRKAATFLFAGDTAYCNAFKEIGQVFGPFTGAAIPIGAYKPRWFLKTSHIDPDEAVKIHRDLKSKKSISMHHSTFVLSTEYYKEPSIRLQTLMENLKLNSSVQEPFISLKHGETTLFSNILKD